MSRPHVSGRQRAFSVFELIVVLALLLALLGLFLPAMQKVREAAGRMESGNNLKQMVLAMHSCQDVYKKLPPAIGWFPRQQPRWAKPAEHGTLYYHILPFMEGDNVHNNTSYFSATNTGTVIKEFIAPLDFTAPKSGLHFHNRGAISYGVNTYALMDYRNFVNSGYSTWGYTGKPAQEVSTMSLPKMTDGTSNTIAIVERFASCQTPILGKDGQIGSYRSFERVWGEDMQGYNNFSPAVYRPLNSAKGQTGLVPPELLPQFGANRKSCEPATWQAFGPGAIQVGMFDGSVRGVAPGISRETWTYALLPDDGNVLGPDF